MQGQTKFQCSSTVSVLSVSAGKALEVTNAVDLIGTNGVKVHEDSSIEDGSSITALLKKIVLKADGTVVAWGRPIAIPKAKALTVRQ